MRSITPRRQTDPSVRWGEPIFQAEARRIRQASTYRILDNLDHNASHMGATASSMIMMARLACKHDPIRDSQYTFVDGAKADALLAALHEDEEASRGVNDPGPNSLDEQASFRFGFRHLADA